MFASMSDMADRGVLAEYASRTKRTSTSAAAYSTTQPTTNDDNDNDDDEDKDKDIESTVVASADFLFTARDASRSPMRLVRAPSAPTEERIAWLRSVGGGGGGGFMSAPVIFFPALVVVDRSLGDFCLVEAPQYRLDAILRCFERDRAYRFEQRLAADEFILQLVGDVSRALCALHDVHGGRLGVATPSDDLAAVVFAHGHWTLQLDMRESRPWHNEQAERDADLCAFARIVASVVQRLKPATTLVRLQTDRTQIVARPHRSRATPDERVLVRICSFRDLRNATRADMCDHLPANFSIDRFVLWFRLAFGRLTQRSTVLRDHVASVGGGN